MNKNTLIRNHSEQTTTAADTHTDELNIKMTRRHLLKGAALGAPVILTLRSGALMAAASCNTGIKGYIGDGTTLNPDDYCVQLIQTCDNGTGKKVNSASIGYGDQAIPITDGYGNTTYMCPSPPDGSSYTYSIILSSAAYTSLTKI
ncbi:hypothetical protein CKO09_03145 [Chromatium weissei]|nr:hypothetical protein [Chromatium weissei]